MSNVWFVGDLHLGHRNICKYRPEFKTTKEHDEFVTERVLSVSNKNSIKRDTLVLMGDCFFTEESLDSLRKFRKAFRQIIFVMGNHDSDSPERQQNLISIIKEDLVDKIHACFSKYGFWFSHSPIHPEELRGKKNVHGHCHNYVITDTEKYRCVSLEQINYTPISLEQLRKEMQPTFYKNK